MALTLSLRKGDAFRVGDERILLKEVFGDGYFLLVVRGVEFHVSDDRREEILPNIFVSAGDRRNGLRSASVIVDAPRDVGIWREDKYLERQSARAAQVPL